MKKRALIILAAAVLAAAALFYVYFTTEGEGAGIPCVFYQITGFYCSGCGASRALRSILHLDFYQAIRYNAVFTAAFPMLAAYFSALSISYIRFGEDRISRKIPVKFLWIIIGAAILYGILRNIPPFDFLAPVTL